MIILGIDPGIATLGYGVVDKDRNGNCRAIDYGVVLTPKEETLPVRLAILEEGVNRVIDRFSPEEIAMEELFFSKNITTGMAVSMARGVALATVVERTDNLYEYTPMQIKQAVTGYGKADKAQVQQMVKMITGMDSIIRPDDAADAVAAAICHAHSRNARQMFKIT